MYEVFNMGHRMELYAQLKRQRINSISQSFGWNKIVGRVEAAEKKLTIKSLNVLLLNHSFFFI